MSTRKVRNSSGNAPIMKKKRSTRISINALPALKSVKSLKHVRFNVNDRKSSQQAKVDSDAAAMFQRFSEDWKVVRESYKKEEKVSEDANLRAIAESVESTTLVSSEFLFLFDKYRELRELVLRMHGFELKKLLRKFLSNQRLDLALNMMKIVEVDAMFFETVDREDEVIGGVSALTKEKLLKLIDQDIFEDDLSTWISYILFFSSPAAQWDRLKRLFFDFYFELQNTALMYLMLNNHLSDLKTMMAVKLPTFLKSASDYSTPTLVRVDRHFSRFKTKPCLKGCQGHNGKLLLVMIRLGNFEMVEFMVKHGLSVSSQCCSGNIKKLFWVENKKTKTKKKKSKENDEYLLEEERLMQDVEFKRPREDGLKAEYEFITPLAVAVECGNVRMVKLLLSKGANPLVCSDIAIRTCVENVVARKHNQMEISKKRASSNVHEHLTDEVVAFEDEHQHIFEEIMSAAEKALKKTNQFVGGYCRNALVYQAVLDERWEAEKILTALKERKDYFARTLNRYNITAASVLSTIQGPSWNKLSSFKSRMGGAVSTTTRSMASFSPEENKIESDKISRNRSSMFPTSPLRKKNTQKSQRLTQVRKLVGSTVTRMRSRFNNMKASKNIRGSKIVTENESASVLSPRSSEPKKSANDDINFEQDWLSEVEDEVVGGTTDYIEVNNEMREDLCFTLVSVIDKLLTDILETNIASHGTRLYGIVRIMERHELYLDESRNVLLLQAGVKALKEMQPGDKKGVDKLLENRQFQNFLGVNIDRYWKKRDIRHFLKTTQVQVLLGLRQGRGSLAIVPSIHRRSSLQVMAGGVQGILSKDDLYNQMMMLLAKRNYAQFIHVFSGGNCAFPAETRENMMKLACVHESLDAIDAISSCFGKHFLDEGLRISLEHQKSLSCQKILSVDTELSATHVGLLRNYISQPLFIQSQLDLDSRHFKDEEEELDLISFEGTINFFFACLSDSPNLENILTDILMECLSSEKFLNMKALMLYIELCLDRFSGFVDEEILVAFIKSKSSQFDALSDLVEKEVKKQENSTSRINVIGVSTLPLRNAFSRPRQAKIKNWNKRQQQREEKRDLRQARWLKVLTRLVDLADESGNNISIEIRREVEDILKEMPEKYVDALEKEGDIAEGSDNDDAWTYAEDEWGNKPLL